MRSLVLAFSPPTLRAKTYDLPTFRPSDLPTPLVPLARDEDRRPVVVVLVGRRADHAADLRSAGWRVGGRRRLPALRPGLGRGAERRQRRHAAPAARRRAHLPRR